MICLQEASNTDGQLNFILIIVIVNNLLSFSYHTLFLHGRRNKRDIYSGRWVVLPRNLRLRQSIPIPGDRHIAWIAQGKDQLGKAIGVTVAQIERASAVNSNGVDAIIVPIACDGLIAGHAIIESDIRKACVIAILQEDHSTARAEDSGRGDAIPIPISDDPYITWIAQSKTDLRRASIIGVAQVERPIAKDTDRVDAIAIPIACDRLITWRAEGEDNLGEAIGVGISQVESSVTVDPDGIGAIPIPVPGHGIIPTHAIIEGDIGKAALVLILEVQESIAGAEDTCRITAIFPLILIRSNVTMTTLWSRHPALVYAIHGRSHTDCIVALIDRRRPAQQSMRLCGTSMIRQRAQLGIGITQGSFICPPLAGAAAVQVVAAVDDAPRAILSTGTVCHDGIGEGQAGVPVMDASPCCRSRIV